MREINHIIRKGIISKLSDLTYLGEIIPVSDEFIKTGEGAILNIGNTTKCEAYVIISNQTDNEAATQNKCNESRSASIQLNIVTIFNSNSGGKIHSELICNEILGKLFDGHNLDIDFSADNITVVSADYNLNSFTQDTKTQRVYNKIITILNRVNYGN